MRTRLAIVGVVALVLAACGDDSGDGGCDDPPALAGSWAGTLADRNAGTGTIAVTFTQVQCSLGGSWSGSFVTAGADGGSLAGNADGSSVDATLSGLSSCVLQVSGVLNGAGDAITGTYSTENCGPVDGGTFTIDRLTPTPTATGTVTPTATPTSSGTVSPTTTASPTPTATPPP
jgi:hypothetical protein